MLLGGGRKQYFLPPGSQLLPGLAFFLEKFFQILETKIAAPPEMWYTDLEIDFPILEIKTCGIIGMSGARHFGIVSAPSGTWVQTERAAHEKWAQLAVMHPRACALMHVIVSRMGRHNALVASQKTLAKLTGCTDRTVRTALQVLRNGGWLEIRQIGPTGTACAYVVNDRVAWSGNRDGIRYSLFSAAVLISDDEQPDKDELGLQAPLEHVPALRADERQLPAGDGLDPPTQPPLTGLEPDLPARRTDIEEAISLETLRNSKRITP